MSAQNPEEVWGLIGTVAGEIYNAFVNSPGPVALDDIRLKVDREEVLVKMALGWLCREGNVMITRDGGKFAFQLVKPQ